MAGCSFFHKIMNHQKYCMLTMQVQNKTKPEKTPESNDKLEPIRDVSEIWNHSHMTKFQHHL